MEELLKYMLCAEGLEIVEVMDNRDHYIVFLKYKGNNYELTLFNCGKIK